MLEFEMKLGGKCP